MATTNQLDREIQDKVQSFAQELAQLVRQAAVEAVTGALGAGGAAPRRGRPRGRPAAASAASPAAAPRRRKGRRAGAGRRGKRVRRSPEQLGAISDDLYKYVKANPGESIEQIGKGLGRPTSDLKRPATNLLEQKKLRTTGQRRGTKYFAR